MSYLIQKKGMICHLYGCVIKQKNMKTIAITGCARRFGFSLVSHFLTKGWQVVAISRKPSNDLLALKSEFHANLSLINCQTYDVNGANSVLQQNNLQDADVLINNASYYEDDGVEIEDVARKLQMFFDVHMLFPTLLAESFCRSSKNVAPTNERVVINITDIFAENPAKPSGHYCSTKAGLESLTQSLAKKYAPNIRVNSIQPGPVKFLPSHSQSAIDRVLSETLLASEGGFDVLINAVEFILGNHYVTGSAIKIDGGRAINRA